MSVGTYRRHLSNGGWVVAINLARQVLALGFLMVLVRAFDKEAVGQFQFVIAAVGLAGIFTLAGLGQAVIQSVARGHPGTFRTTLKWRLAGSLAGSVALAAYALLLSVDDPMRPALIAAALLFPLAHGLAGWTDVQAGEGKFKLNAIWQGLAYLLSYGGMMLALWLGTPGILWLIVIMKSALAVVNLAAVRTILGRIPRDAAAEPGALRYGLQMSLWGVANTLGNHVDKVLIFTFLSPAALAVFVIAERIPEIMKKYIQSLRVILIPGFSRRKAYTPELQRKIWLVSVALSVGILFVIFGIVPWLLPLAFTEGYGEAVLYCQLLCGTLILGQVAQTQVTFIVSRFDGSAMRNVILISNLVRIVASLILVPIFGILGAIASTALYRLSTAMIVTLMMRRYHPTEGAA
ncbi:MAG: oligosaccharide flippase family protein [Rubellimicrobium sp.]|nr:oligosaccharide flippase family protein [Rubellimicrobium sp.]